MSINLTNLLPENHVTSSSQEVGSIESISGGIVRSRLTAIQLGELCYIHTQKKRRIPTQVVGFSESKCYLAPFEPLTGVSPGDIITKTGSLPLLTLPYEPSGRVYDCLAHPLDSTSKSKCHSTTVMEIETPVPNPLSRPLIRTQMKTGIRAIDICCPIGLGQRIGLFAGPGVGKSTLLGMIAKGASVDRIIISLVGERGREVNEFLEEALGEDGLKRSIVIVSTSDEQPIRRKHAAISATRIAEHYRDRGENVLLLIDSLTRAARAIRDVSLSTGELPVRQGYTASVFEELPRILERSGTASTGSITAIYTILSEALEAQDVLSEEIKSLLDGHIVLDKELAHRGYFPAIDLTSSISRLTSQLCSQERLKHIHTIRDILCRLKNEKELIQLGGTPDAKLTFCLEHENELLRFLHHGTSIEKPLSHADEEYIRSLHDLYQRIV
ncbi:FliI/YscN family ATPase [bacterium]|jgi:flagellum-specific ATP synthase|nr:FliI/YscN family ATPase [bacterium]